MAQATLRAGRHYIDVTAEQASARASFAQFDAPARAAGRVVIPAAGFYGGLADLLASAPASAGDIDEITVAIALDRWWPTADTRRIGERNQAPHDIRDATTPPPSAVDDRGRSAQQFEPVVRLVLDGVTRTAGVRGQDIYAVTAPIVMEAAAQRLLAASYCRSGALALAEAVDPVELLRTLHGSGLDRFGDALPV